jgi:Zn-dependent membrane protease YugP
MSKDIVIGISWNKDNPRPLFSLIYEKIVDKLTVKGYKIKSKYIDDFSWSERIDMVADGECDTSIDAYYITSKRLDEVNFTTTVGILLPKIIYAPEMEKQENTKYFFYLLDIWKKPFIYLFILATIISLILRFSNNKSYKKYGLIHSFYHSIAGFFGQTGGILSDGYGNLMSSVAIISTIICFFIIYLFTIYIQASTTAKSVKYFNDTNKLERSIRGERILAYTQSKFVKNLLEDKDAVVVPMPEKNGNITIFDYYEKNRKKLKLSGFYYGGTKHPKLKEKASEYNYKVSNLSMGSHTIAFPVNKKKTQLLKDLNHIILNFSENNTFFHTCATHADKDFIVC